MTKKSDTVESPKIQTVPLTLRAQSFFRKLKGCFDGLVNAYCNLTKIGVVEAKDLVSKKAATLMSRGQYGKAIDHYNKLIGMGHEESKVYYNIGICCEREGMDEEAEEAYKKAYEMDKGLTDAVYRLGLLAIKNDDSKTAVKYLGALACKKNVSFDALYNLGVAHDKLKDYEKAVESFKKAMAVEPNYSKVHKRLGYTYEAMGNREEAMECFKKAMELEEI
jgi:tetratricopeptide (TPR) repeat protein